MTTSTSAALEPFTPWPPAKITSFIVWPRTASGLCSPSAHSTASVMFDLPEPLGPTTTDTPGRELELGAVREGLEALHRDRPQVHQPPPLLERVERVQGGLLLGALLGLALPAADLQAVDLGHGDEAAVVRRPLLGVDPVDDHLRALRKPLLEHRLVVHGVLERLLDLLVERRTTAGAMRSIPNAR